MQCNLGFFLGGIVRTTLVRDGNEVILPKGQHTIGFVYTEMLLQICRDYPGLPDPRTLSMGEVRFFYDGLRRELIKHTKQKG